MHGVNGARIVITDYVSNPTGRRLLIGLFAVLGTVWIVLGIAIIVLFDPDAGTALAGWAA